MNDLPGDLYYTNEHEWLRKEEDGSITVGITDYAQNELGDIVFIENPIIGDNFIKGESIATIEAVKTVSDIYAPISGEIISINNDIDQQPNLINQDPYYKGWLIKMNIKNKNELNNLLTSNEYEKIIK